MPSDRTDALPPLLRQAMAYIDGNAHTGIGLTDIAAAIHVTPRTVQYMFNRHLDTTPLTYLRRVRLDHAHRDLAAADPMSDTVTEIAARWGWMHPGRFSVAYKAMYGESPSSTLRGSSAPSALRASGSSLWNPWSAVTAAAHTGEK